MPIPIPENDAGQRLDRYLRKAFRATPMSLIQKALRTGKVRVNGRRADGDQRLVTGDWVLLPDEWFREKEKKQAGTTGRNDFRAWVIFEDENILAINKPAGIPVHEGTGHTEGTLSDLLSAYLPDNAGNSRTFRPAFAHRLDSDTSGVILAGKSAVALRSLTAQFREGRAQKEYRAWAGGTFTEQEGTLETPLADKEGTEQSAVTLYRVLKTAGEFTLLSIRILTGRTHQIRRHLAGIGHPVAGDRRYNGANAERLMLHAFRVSIEDPVSGGKRTFEAPMPGEFERPGHLRR
ncbi:MAG: RluA family pseudouridine synthase [Fibrobacterota bacterium]